AFDFSVLSALGALPGGPASAGFSPTTGPHVTIRTPPAPSPAAHRLSPHTGCHRAPVVTMPRPGACSTPVSTTLLTPRLRLRPLSASDTPQIVALHTDPAVLRYLGRPVDIDTVRREHLPRLLRVDPHSGRPDYLAAETRDDARVPATPPPAPAAPSPARVRRPAVRRAALRSRGTALSGAAGRHRHGAARAPAPAVAGRPAQRPSRLPRRRDPRRRPCRGLVHA